MIDEKRDTRLLSPGDEEAYISGKGGAIDCSRPPQVIYVESKQERRKPWTRIMGWATLSLFALAYLFLPVRTGPTDVTSPPAVNAGDGGLCQSPQCIIAAASILQSLAPESQNVDPCDDFNNFVCAGWRETHDLRSDQSGMFAGTLMAERAFQMLRHVIEGEYPDTSAHSSFSPRQLLADSKETDKENFKKLKDAYNACMDEDKMTEVGGKPLTDLLKDIQQTYPKSGQYGDFGLTEAIVKLNKMNVNAFFAFNVGADDKDPENTVLSLFDAGNFGLPSKEYYKQPKVVEDYSNAIEAFMSNILGSEMSESEYKAMASNVVQFEAQLASISADAQDMWDVTKTYNPHTIGELQSLFTPVMFRKIFDALSPNYEPKRIIVSSPNYLRNLTTILENTDKTTVQSYLLTRVAVSYASYVSSEVNRPLSRFWNIMGGREPDSKGERWKTCVSEMDDSLGWILGRFYIEKAFPEKAKTLGNQIITDIKDQFVESLKTLDWVSDNVKKLAIEKVHSIEQKVGYPEEHPNVKSPEDLKSFYSKVEIGSDTFFQNGVSVARSQVEKEWEQLGKPTDHKAFGMTPPTVNAYYNPPMNEIVFPAGILQMPVFNVELPNYMNYGAFGSVSGHELSHAFDSTGRHYDMKGNYTDWWDEDTVKAFKEKSQCFVKQYSEFSVEGPDGKPLHVNGDLTLGENIADAGGVNAAFKAWKEREKEHADPHLPGLQKFTKEQLFFVSYGSWWCGVKRKEEAIRRIYTDPHSPEWARILGTVANSKDFLEAFKCPKKEPRCKLW